MNKLTLSILTLFFSIQIFSQTNSVSLKDGGGSLLSQHNSISAAYGTIPGTVSQAYIIEILAIYDGSNETFPITLGQKTGSSASNTITIRPAAGNTGEIVTGSSTTGIINIDGADFLIIDGRPGGTGSAIDLKIQNTASTGTAANTILFINSANNNIVKYTHVLNATQAASGPRAIEFGASNTGLGSNDNTVTDCKIEGGRSCIGFEGSTGILNTNTTISNCEIFNFGYAGIWLLSNAAKIMIENCLIYQTVGVNNTLNTGINIGSSISDTVTIRKNKIYSMQSTSTSTGNTARGIWFQTGAPAGSVYNIQNNFISQTLDNASAQNIIGIDVTGANAFTVNAYYNSIRIGGNHTAGTSGSVVSAGIRSTSAGVTLNAKNNICINNRTGGTSGVIHAGFSLSTAPAAKSIDNNAYFATGTNSVHAAWLGTGFTVIGPYRTAANPDEQNTVFQNVSFVSNTDLHLTGGSNGDPLLTATPIAGITTDIDNAARNPVNPYKGADEGSILLSVQQVSTVPGKFELSQNYPNPFNPSTTISFQLPVGGFTLLKIYDITGREVAVVVNDLLTAGKYEFKLDAGNLASGVYFYSLKSGEFSMTKQMVLVK